MMNDLSVTFNVIKISTNKYIKNGLGTQIIILFFSNKGWD